MSLMSFRNFYLVLPLLTILVGCVDVITPGTGDGPGVGGECGGALAVVCADGLFCQLEAGACLEDGPPPIGVCTELTEACPAIYAPVCGCDGRTYGNACTAASAGASVAHEGECEVPPPAGECGGLLDVRCGDGEYCHYEPGVCGGLVDFTDDDPDAPTADSTGICRPLPGEDCEAIYAPICGCDGRTYSNECIAASAGVSVLHEGECERPPSGECGGPLDVECAEGFFCRYEPGTCGGPVPRPGEGGGSPPVHEATGTCEPRPDACYEVYAPVCGCDGRTYDNDCFASSAGVSVQHEGECGAPPSDECGGPLGVVCAEGSYCRYDVGMCGGSPDAGTGTCEPRPDACYEIYAPVCGCDGRTYDNDCFAASAGVNIEHTGRCEAPGRRTCGTILGLTCSDAEYCEYPIATCGLADRAGICQPRPEVCPDIWMPICGCDGTTYSNRCDAAAAGAAIAYEGACRRDG